MEERIRAFVEANTGADAEILDFQRLPGGYSQETYAFRLRQGGHEQELILRKKPASGGILQSDLGSEYRLLQVLHRLGFPVAKMHWLDESGEYLGQPGFCMERVPGDSKPEPLFEPGREELLAKISNEVIDNLGRLHALDPREFVSCGFAIPDDWDAYIHAQIDELEAGMRQEALEGMPNIAELLRWLRRNIPEPAPFRLVHCDYQFANFMYDESGLKAVIDWEIAHIGDPREDLGWLQVMIGLFGYDFAPYVEGGLLERYARTSGLQATPEAVLFFQILRGFAVTYTVLKNWRGFASKENRDIMAPYTCINVMRGMRVQLDAVGMGRSLAGAVR